MGSDIHMYCEYMFKDEWKSGDYFMINPYEEVDKYYVVPLYDGRNYELFGILAGIRSNEHEPIATYRGVPNDSCDTIRHEKSEWGNDGHSHNWLTYKEIVDRIKKDCRKYKNIGGYSNHILYRIAKSMAQRMTNVFWLFDVNDIDDPKLMERANDFRIVFWFDS